MTKEEYLKYRNQGQIPLSAFWEYYSENCEHPLVKTEEEFVLYFQKWLNPVISQGVAEKVTNYFDKKFSVNQLSFKGELIAFI